MVRRVFFDDFESGNTNKWPFIGTFDRATVVKVAKDGKGPYSGQYMLEGNWNGAVAWPDTKTYAGLNYEPLVYTREFLVSARVRWDADVDKKFGAKVLRIGGGDNSFIAGAQMQEVGAPLWASLESQGSQQAYGVPPFGDGVWRRLRVYIKENLPGVSDGTIRVWADDVLMLERVNIVTTVAGQKWTQLNLMSNWSSNGPLWDHDANNHVYWDEVEIFSDSTTGEPATGNLSDGSAAVGAVVPPVDPCAAVKAENTVLKSQVLQLQTQVSTLTTQVSTLKAKIAKAKVSADASVIAAQKVRSDLA